MNEELKQKKQRIEEAKKRDRIGVTGEVIAVTGVAATALASSGSIAAALGVANIIPAQLLGSAWLASVTGWAGTAAVVTTPIGWTLAITAGISAAAYGVMKLIHSGGINDQRRQELAKHLRKEIKAIEAAHIPQQQIDAIIATINKLVADGQWDAAKGEKFIAGVRSGSISIQLALKVLQGFVGEMESPTISTGQTPEQIEKKGVAAHIFTALKKTLHGNSQAEPGADYFTTMASKYNISRERALQIYQDAPVGENAAQTAREFASVFNQAVMQDAWQALQQTAESMASGQQAFSRYLEMERVMQTQLNKQLAKVNDAGAPMSAAIDRL